jgi:FkbM family methyltransferase
MKKQSIAEQKLNDHIRSSKNFFVVQIGANDGKMADPIHNLVKKYKWNGLFIEPVEYLFNKLKKNYEGCDSLIFENLAITEENGYVDFYQFPQELENNEDFPYWAPGMGSVLKPFDSPGHNTLKQKNFQMVIRKTPCMTFNSLVEKHNINEIDLLQIDVEGYDGQLIKSINFDKIKPKYIRYEDKHINRAYNEKLTNINSEQVIEYLESVGYNVDSCNNGFDRVCFLN